VEQGTSNAYSYPLYAEIVGCVAVVDPANQEGPIGSVFSLDASRSYSPTSGAVLEYRWHFAQVPPGSAVSITGFDLIEPDGSVVSFTPDIVGFYLVELSVYDGHTTSDTVEAITTGYASLVPYCKGITPDANFVWSFLNDAWKLVPDRDYITSIWGGYMQAISADILKMFQIDYNKSISDVQDMFRRRWYQVPCRLSLKGTEWSAEVGESIGGDIANTGTVGSPGVGFAYNSTTLIIMKGTISDNSKSKPLALSSGPSWNSAADGWWWGDDTVYSKTYRVYGLNPQRDGYTLFSDSESFLPENPSIAGPLFPKGTGSRYADYSSMVAGTTAGTQEVTLWTDSVGGTPLVTTGIVVGSFLEIKTGADTGYYEVEVIVGNTLTLDGWVSATASADFDLFAPVSFVIIGSEGDYTTTVSVPYATSGFGFADLDLLKGSMGEVGRLLHINGRSYVIENLVKIEDVPPTSMNVLTIGNGEVKSGLVSIPWRISNTLKVEGYDFEEEGIVAGDLLVFEVSLVGKMSKGKLYTTVLGVQGDRIGFEWTIDDFIFPDTLDAPTAELVALASLFEIRAVSYRDDVLDTSFEADDIRKYLKTANFRRSFFGKTVDSEFELEVGAGYKAKFSPLYLAKNTFFKVDDEVTSLPCLQEYIVQPKIIEENGLFYTESSTGYKKNIARQPIFMAENQDFVVDSEQGQLGIGANTIGGVGTIEVVNGSLLGRRFLPGDTIELTDGMNLGTYTISDVLSEDEISVEPTPEFDQYYGSYKLNRKNPGTYVRMLADVFTPANPSPENLWCEEAFFDNSDSIEDNFGYRVNLAKEDFDDKQTSSTYKESIMGLLYVFSHSPTPANVKLGVSILVGLPFALHRGIVRDINDEYITDPLSGRSLYGRVLVEDVDGNDVPIRILRSYVYPASDALTEEYFASLDTLSEGFAFYEDEFYGLEINPETGEKIKLGDILEQYTLVSKGVQVLDYINDEDWFSSLFTSIPYIEVLKYHNFAVRIRAGLVDANDMDFVMEFLLNVARPTYQNVFAFLMKFLVDYVNVDDALYITSKLTFIDTPGGGLQEGFTTDALSGSGVPLYQADGPPLVQRSKWKVNDLKITPMPFGPPVPHIAMESDEIVEFTGIFDRQHHTGGFLNPAFFAGVVIGGENIPGDIVYVLHGPNKGGYEIVHKGSSTEIAVVPLDEDHMGFMPYMGTNAVTETVAEEGAQAVIIHSMGLFVSGVGADAKRIPGMVAGVFCTKVAPNILRLDSGLSADLSLISEGDLAYSMAPTGPDHTEHQVKRVFSPTGGEYIQENLTDIEFYDDFVDVIGSMIFLGVFREHLRSNEGENTYTQLFNTNGPGYNVNLKEAPAYGFQVKVGFDITIDGLPYKIVDFDFTTNARMLVYPAPPAFGPDFIGIHEAIAHNPKYTGELGNQLDKVLDWIPDDELSLIVTPDVPMDVAGELLNVLGENMKSCGFASADFVQFHSPTTLSTWDLGYGEGLIPIEYIAGAGPGSVVHLTQTSPAPGVFASVRASFIRNVL